MATEVAKAGEVKREYLRFSGRAQDYFRIWIVNVLLTILTLGIYSAWAKVRRNRYIYGHTTLRDDRFDYHANPLVILRGRAVAVSLLLIVLATQAYYPSFTPLVGTVVAVVIPWLIVRSRMFNMRNTSCSNIRFGFLPAYWDSFRTFFFAGLLAVGTFGIGAPVAHYLRNRFVLRNTRYGNLPFNMDTAITDFFTAYLLTFIASSIIIFPLFTGAFGLLDGFNLLFGNGGASLSWLLPTLVVLAAYYIGAQFLSAATLRPTIDASSIIDADGENRLCTLGCDWNLNRLLFMYVVNFVLVVCTVGLLIPWARMRVTRYLVDGIWVELHSDINTVVAQKAREISSVGEEVGGAFDVDFGL